jgi:3,4-dihydroxy 2-butanone 4-phosphate synthase/GTP cyclohydrolase II
MKTQLASIEEAIADLKQGKMIILVDDENRENEGDLVMAAEKVTPESINFMTQHARGLVCMPMSQSDFERLQIPLMTQNNTNKHQTAFGVSIGAANGITTGISAADRAYTIKVAVDPGSSMNDLSIPGHIFPLCAKEGGVLERDGHTEGSVDLMRLAGLRPASAICEVMNEDGTMARMPQLVEFAKKHDLKIASIKDLITYRIAKDTIVELVSSAHLPTKHGKFTIQVYRNLKDGIEHVAMIKEPLDPNRLTLTRIHSECLTGDILHSIRCDCGAQLDIAMQKIAEQGGVLLYLRQEGRGIGLANKIKAYSLQDQGLDTVEANHHLGFEADQREYAIAAHILRLLDIDKVRLLTNNPRKIDGLMDHGVEVVERLPLLVDASEENVHYLQTKRDKLGHLFD